MFDRVPSREELLAMGPEALTALMDELRSIGPVVSFPWHAQQERVLQAATNVVIALGGNQSGKTTVGRGVVSRLANREGPVYRRLRRPNRPLKIWVSPQTLEKFKSNWERQLIKEVFSHLPANRWKYVSAPIPVFKWVDEHTDWEHPNELWGKSHDQGFMAFESDVVDLIVFDEEPLDRRLYTSGLARLSTTNGIILFTFTPLNGLSWTHAEFYQPLVKPRGDPGRYKLADRHWKKGNDVTLVQMGMADNPEAVAGGGVVRLLGATGITEAERRMRLYGEYGYTEGMIWEAFAGVTMDQDAPFLLDRLPGDRKYNWFLVADPNKRHGALLCAIDHEGIKYAVEEHYAEDWSDRRHAQRYRALAKRRKLSLIRDVEVFADPGGAGAQAILNLADLGIHAGAVPKGGGSVKASIEMVRRDLEVDPHLAHPLTGEPGSPRLFLLRTLRSQWKEHGVEYDESRLLWECRQYRQKEGAAPDTPIKEKDDLVDPLRYLYLIRGIEPEPPEDAASKAEREVRENLDPTSLRATLEFEELLKDITSGRRRAQDAYDETLGSLKR